METDKVRVRVKSGDSEIEIESSKPMLDEAIEKAESLLLRMSETSAVHSRTNQLTKTVTTHEPLSPNEMPRIVIEKGDSLGDILGKLFSTSWGGTPKRLAEVLGTLRSYGAIYPKSSVAVSLLRMVHAGKLRRFKDNGGFVYVAPSPVVTGHGPLLSSE